jgi:Putative SAM-dependent methyltransferase
MILDVFEEVLSNLDSEGEDECGDNWVDLVRERLFGLEAAYRILTQQDRSRIDYAEISTQAAYVFAYGMPRAGFTYERLKRHRETLGKPLFATPDIRVASVGGGPASELVGLIAYLNDAASEENVASIAYTIFDLGEEWENVANLTAECIPPNIEVALNFQRLNLLDAAEILQTSLAGNQLVIFSYVISELCAFKARMPVVDNIRMLLRTLDPGAFVFYMDSESYPFYSTFNSCKAQVMGLKELKDLGGNTYFDAGEYSGTFERYCTELDRDPRLDGNIVSKLLKRD